MLRQKHNHIIYFLSTLMLRESTDIKMSSANDNEG